MRGILCVVTTAYPVEALALLAAWATVMLVAIIYAFAKGRDYAPVLVLGAAMSLFVMVANLPASTRTVSGEVSKVGGGSVVLSDGSILECVEGVGVLSPGDQVSAESSGGSCYKITSYVAASDRGVASSQ